MFFDRAAVATGLRISPGDDLQKIIVFQVSNYISVVSYLFDLFVLYSKKVSSSAKRYRCFCLKIVLVCLFVITIRSLYKIDSPGLIISFNKILKD